MSGAGVPAGLSVAREEFAALVAEVRPALHRYCARMTGSVLDGEDVVQETLVRAFYALSEMETVPPLRPWLFRIARNCMLDDVKRYERRMREPADDALADARATGDDPEAALGRAEAERIAVSRFVELPPSQRSAVILKDVLDASLEDVASVLDVGVPAVKALLHRGRTRLRALAETAPVAAAPSAQLVRYTELFRARDWNALRGLLADDVRLDLVGRHQRSGRSDVGRYFTNYAAHDELRFGIAVVDGRALVAVFAKEGDAAPTYFVDVRFGDDGGVREIRDYRYVPYVARDARAVVIG